MDFLLGSRFFHCPNVSIFSCQYHTLAVEYIVCIQIMWWLQLCSFFSQDFFWLFEFFVIQYFNFYFYWWNILAVVNATMNYMCIVTNPKHTHVHLFLRRSRTLFLAWQCINTPSKYESVFSSKAQSISSKIEYISWIYNTPDCLTTE